MLDTAIDPLSGFATALVLAARVAARLSRDTDRHCDDVGRDAVAIALAAYAARAARFTGREDDYSAAIRQIAAAADRYGAAVIEANDAPSGMIVGLDLGPTTTHRSGHPHNWFYLA